MTAVTGSPGLGLRLAGRATHADGAPYIVWLTPPIPKAEREFARRDKTGFMKAYIRATVEAWWGAKYPDRPLPQPTHVYRGESKGLSGGKGVVVRFAGDVRVIFTPMGWSRMHIYACSECDLEADFFAVRADSPFGDTFKEKRREA